MPRSKFEALLLAGLLSACSSNGHLLAADGAAVCGSAQVKDMLLDRIASAVASNSSGVLTFFGGRETFGSIRKNFEASATLENVRIDQAKKDTGNSAVTHCVVDVLSVNLAAANAKVRFRNVRFTIDKTAQSSGRSDGGFGFQPDRSSFFASMEVNGNAKVPFDFADQGQNDPGRDTSLDGDAGTDGVAAMPADQSNVNGPAPFIPEEAEARRMEAND